MIEKPETPDQNNKPQVVEEDKSEEEEEDDPRLAMVTIPTDDREDFVIPVENLTPKPEESTVQPKPEQSLPVKIPTAKPSKPIKST